jgi:hypothetical protein
MKYLYLLLRVAVAALISLPSMQLHAAGGSKRPYAEKRNPAVLNLHADLDTAAALPSNAESATGDVIATYDTATHVLKFRAYFVGLTGEATNARFHGPAAFDRAAAPTVAAARPAARLVVGSAWLDTEEEHDLLAGRWYFNVTTEKHPDGEIRGMVHIHETEHP